MGKIGRITVTPTRILHFPMEVETLNRVLRQYQDISDRFIRVTFAGEIGERIIYSSNKDLLTLFFERCAPLPHNLLQCLLQQQFFDQQRFT